MTGRRWRAGLLAGWEPSPQASPARPGLAHSGAVCSWGGGAREAGHPFLVLEEETQGLMSTDSSLENSFTAHR